MLYLGPAKANPTLTCKQDWKRLGCTQRQELVAGLLKGATLQSLLQRCMQDVSAVQEYKDVDLDDGTYKRVDISRLLTDDEVKHVVGKLKRV